MEQKKKVDNSVSARLQQLADDSVSARVKQLSILVGEICEERVDLVLETSMTQATVDSFNR